MNVHSNQLTRRSTFTSTKESSIFNPSQNDPSASMIIVDWMTTEEPYRSLSWNIQDNIQPTRDEAAGNSDGAGAGERCPYWGPP